MRTAQETPYFAQVPVDHGVHAHEVGPIAVRAVEVRQGLAVRVGAAGADEDCADGRVGIEIEGEGIAEGYCLVFGAIVMIGCTLLLRR